MISLDKSKVNNLLLVGFLVWIALSIMTNISIYLIYRPIIYKHWPASRFSFTMAALTCLWTYALWFFRLVSRSEEYSSVSFAIVFVPLDFLLVYPGLERLGIESDKHAYKLIVSLFIIHGFGSFLIQRRIKEHVEIESAID